MTRPQIPGISNMKLTKQRLKEIIKEELDNLQTSPRHEGGTAEQRLLNKLLIRSKVDKIGDPARAAEMLGLGEDEEVIAYLADLMGNPMLDAPGSFGLGEYNLAFRDADDPDEIEEQWDWRDEDTPSGYPMTNKQKRAEIGMPEEEPLRLSRPKHDPLDRSPAGIRARRRLQGKGIKNYPLDK